MKNRINMYFIIAMLQCYSSVLFALPSNIAFHSLNYRSPLDDPGIDMPEITGESVSVHQSSGNFPSEMLAGDIYNVAACRQTCTTKFSEVIKFAIRSPNHYERFKNVCNRYNETVRCMDESNAVCFNHQPFNVFTSGLYYMCIEQRKAFEAVIECIDAQASEVQKECDDKCQTKGKMASWAVHSGLLDNLIGRIVVGASNGVAGFARSANQRHVNPQFARKIIQDGCDLTQCQLSCIKVKFNTRCHHNAGTLLSEALVRPLAETQKVMGLNNMQGILNIFLPRQCEFIISGNSLEKFRIDPKLDENLKRLYEPNGNDDAMNEASSFNMTSMDEIESLKKSINEFEKETSQFDEDYIFDDQVSQSFDQTRRTFEQHNDQAVNDYENLDQISEDGFSMDAIDNAADEEIRQQPQIIKKPLF